MQGFYKPEKLKSYWEKKFEKEKLKYSYILSLFHLHQQICIRQATHWGDLSNMSFFLGKQKQVSSLFQLVFSPKSNEILLKSPHCTFCLREMDFFVNSPKVWVFEIQVKNVCVIIFWYCESTVWKIVADWFSLFKNIFLYRNCINIKYFLMIMYYHVPENLFKIAICYLYPIIGRKLPKSQFLYLKKYHWQLFCFSAIL